MKKNLLLIIVIFLLISGCLENPEPEEQFYTFEIPQDKLAFYVIEDLSEEVLYNEIPIDSIKKFGERFISYEEIISYDTVYFSFEILEIAMERVCSINNKYGKWCMPFAVVSKGEVIFGAYLYHPQSSCFPYWYYSTAIRQKKLTIYAPVWTEKPLKTDPRKDPRMINVLLEDGKIKGSIKEN